MRKNTLCGPVNAKEDDDYSRTKNADRNQIKTTTCEQPKCNCVVKIKQKQNNI